MYIKTDAIPEPAPVCEDRSPKEARDGGYNLQPLRRPSHGYRGRGKAGPSFVVVENLRSVKWTAVAAAMKGRRIGVSKARSTEMGIQIQPAIANDHSALTALLEKMGVVIPLVSALREQATEGCTERHPGVHPGC